MLNEYYSLPIKDFCRRASIGITLCRQMVADGRLRSIRAGRKLLIEVDSWREYVERQQREGVPDYTKTRAAIAARKAAVAARQAKKMATRQAASLEDLGL